MDPKKIRIGTFDKDMNSYLKKLGYKRSFIISSLKRSLSKCDVVLGQPGSKVTDDDIKALKKFTKKGGHLFLQDSGYGYDMWWNTPIDKTLLNRVLEDCGTAFSSHGTGMRGSIIILNKALKYASHYLL